jgi:hypothetical protein
MSAILILDPEFDKVIASSFFKEIRSKGLNAPLNFDF